MSAHKGAATAGHATAHDLFLEALADYPWPLLPARAGGGGGDELRALGDKYATGRLRRGEVNARSAEQLRSRLRSFAEVAPADPMRIRKSHVQKWMETPGLSAHYRRSRLSALRGFCRWAVSEGHMRRDPTLDVKLPRVPETLPRRLTVDEARLLVDSVRHDKRVYCAVMLALHLGLRRAELVALDAEDLDYSERTIQIRGKGYGGRVSASLPVPSECWQAITGYLAEAGHSRGPLLRNTVRKHGRLAPSTLSALIAEAMIGAGVKSPGDAQRTPHSLRHTAAHDMLVKTEGDIWITSKMMRHANVNTTQHYARGAPSPGLREAIEGRRYG